MTTNRFRTLTAAAVVALGACAAPTLAQRLGTVPGRGPINSMPAIRTDRQAGWVSFPDIRMGNWGVRSKAPRAIGKVNGTLLPTPLEGRPSLQNDGVRFLPNGGGSNRAGDGRYFFGPGVARDGAGVSIGRDGVNAGAIATGDNWAIAAALRNSIDHSWLRNRGWSRYYNDCSRGDRLYPSYFSDGYYPSTFGGYSLYADPFVVYGNPPAPPQPAVDPEAGLSVPERAALRLREGKPDEAIVLLRSYADAHPYDHDAARALAVALLDARRTKEGVAVMALVYEQSPKLARSPIAHDVVGPERDLRDLVVRVVEFGHRTNTAAAWMTAAVLMQAEGREDPAFKMIERADKMALDNEVSKALRASLKP